MFKNQSYHLTFVVIITAAFCTHVKAAANIYNLGTLGGNTSAANSINSSQQIVGWSNPIADNFSRAYLYTGLPGSGGTMTSLGSLGGLDSFAQGINSSGKITGHSQTSIGYKHAFIYSGIPGNGGAMNDLGTIGGNESQGRAINSSGQIAGFSLNTDGNAHAFLYTGTPGNGGKMSDLGTFGNGLSYAFGINDSGQVAGWSSIDGMSTLVVHAFLYTGTPGNGGQMKDLGTLGGTDSGCLALNNAGQAVGYSKMPGNLSSHAMLYSGIPGNGGSMADLGTLGGTQSTAFAINSSGVIGGQSSISSSSTVHAFVYMGKPGLDGTMIDLDAWVDANNPTEGPKWILSQVSGISDTGWITGYGTYNDGAGGLTDGGRSFILDARTLILPEPSILALFAFGYIVFRRRDK